MSENDILAYLEGRTSADTRNRVHRHLDECHACWLLVQSLVGDGEASSDEPPQAYRITTFAVGNVVANRYRIERFIGKGGMGEVYLARDELMAKAVALKTPLCTSSDDPSALRKFFDEARNADRITHPNICRVYALQEHENAEEARAPIPFFTMEFIEGETLAARLRRAALPLVTARVIARQLLEGLRAAHDKGVLHLDFKSENVMLRRSSSSIEAVIMDFGLSRQRDAVLRTSQYQRGVGTLPYMALEQLEGRRQLSSAVDVYAFGVVLYELLTRSLPFREQTIGGMLVKQMRERPPPPSSLVPELSAEVDAFVMRCLHRASARRYADAGAALAAFERIGSWKRASAGLRRKAALGAAAVLGVAALVAASGRLTSQSGAAVVSVAVPETSAPATESASVGAALEGSRTRERSADEVPAPFGADGLAAPLDTRGPAEVRTPSKPPPGSGARSRRAGSASSARPAHSEPELVTHSGHTNATAPRDGPEGSAPARPRALPKAPIPLTRLLEATRKAGQRSAASEVPADTQSGTIAVERERQLRSGKVGVEP